MKLLPRLLAAASLSALCLAPASTVATTLVAAGHVTAMDATEYGPDCAPNEACLSWFWRFSIDIDQTLSGAKLPAQIRAARLQPAKFTPAHLAALRLFVLEPIEDAEQRRKLQADYYLRQLSPEHRLYCLDGTPERLGLNEQAFVAIQNQEQFCFQLQPKPTAPIPQATAAASAAAPALKEPEFTITGPTLIGFFPPSTEAELAEGDGGIAEGQAHVRFALEDIAACLKLPELATHFELTRSLVLRFPPKGVRRLQFRGNWQHQTGIVLALPGKAPRVVYGLDGPGSLLETAPAAAGRYFGKGTCPPR